MHSLAKAAIFAQKGKDLFRRRKLAVYAFKGKPNLWMRKQVWRVNHVELGSVSIFVFLFFNFVFVFVWQILELQNHKTHKLSKTNHIILPLSNIHTYPGT